MMMMWLIGAIDWLRLIDRPVQNVLCAATRISCYKAVFASDNATTLKGLLLQVLFVEPFVDAALAGFDRSTIQFVWRDARPDEANATLIYALHADDGDTSAYGSARSREVSVAFAQREWVFEWRGGGGDDNVGSLGDALILAALLLCQLLVVVVTVLFVLRR
jgi:hypothetical protein